MNRFLSIFGLLGVLPGILLAVPVSMSLSRTRISQDETASLTIQVEGALQRSLPDLPLPDGLIIRGTSRQDMITNGRRQSRVIYELGAEQPGTYRIGPYSMDIQNETHNLNPVVLTVTPAKVLRSDSDLFVTLDISSPSAYVRQTLEVTLTFYSRNAIEDISLLEFPSEGFEIDDWQEVRAPNRTIGGVSYRTRRYVSQITPLKAGETLLNPTFRIQVAVPQDLQRNSAFPMLSRRYDLQTQRVQVKEPIRLTVKTPPMEGRPASFQGHIGRFQLEASLSPQQVQAGDPITLQVELRGSGSLKEALPPDVPASPVLKAYEPRLVQEDLERGGTSGRKLLEQVLIPLNEEIQEIPALEFSYFDPEDEEYQTLRAGPFPITVRPGTRQNRGPNVVSSLDSPASETLPTLVGEDLLYLHTQPGRLRPLASLQPGLPLVASAAAPFVLAGLFVWTGSLLQSRRDDTAGKRRRHAPRKLRTGLRMLKRLEDPSALAASAWELLAEYLRDRLHLPPGELDPDTLSEHLKHRLPGPTLTELMQWLQQGERARYGGPPTQTDTAELRKSFEAFVHRLDRELRP
jgi:hypothetical protein